MPALSYDQPANFALKYVEREGFNDLYHEVTSLVERTRQYLDTNGRLERQTYDKMFDALYSKMTMQVTTQLMHIAGIALVLRDLNQRNIPINKALQLISSKRGDKIKPIDLNSMDGLPLTFVEIACASDQLRERITVIHTGLSESVMENKTHQNAVHDRLAMLASAF